MLEFTVNGKIFQIKFRYPDKYAGNFRKYTDAILSCKIINPDDPKDYAWETWDETFSTCNLNTDYFNKFLGKKWAFKKLIDRNFDRETRTMLWQKFFELF